MTTPHAFVPAFTVLDDGSYTPDNTVIPHDPCPDCPQGYVCKTPHCGRLGGQPPVGNVVTFSVSCPAGCPAGHCLYTACQRPTMVTRPIPHTCWVAAATPSGGTMPMYTTAPHERYPFSVTETPDANKAFRFADRESCQRFIDWQYRDIAAEARPVPRALVRSG